MNSIAFSKNNIYNRLMETKIIQETKNLIHKNLNFTLDNCQVTVHNFLVDTFENIKGYDTHQHSSFELHYIKKGQGNVAIKDVLFELGPGDLFILDAYTPHSQAVYSKDMHEYALRFDIKELSTHTTNSTSESEAARIIELLSISVNKVFHDQYLIETIFEKAFIDSYNKSPGYYINIKNCIMEIIITTARLSTSSDYNINTYNLPSRSIEVRGIEIITEFINDNIGGHITNHLLARHVHLSERQLHRLIKKHTSLSPHQFVMLLRINRVKQLIDKRGYTLKTISEFTGFSSEFHLSSAFKKHEGVTPREYSKNSIDKFLTTDTEIEI